MENGNWQKLGDVVARILAQTESAIIERTPIETADAELFVQLVNGEIPGVPQEQGAARRIERQGGAESGVSRPIRLRSGGAS